MAKTKRETTSEKIDRQLANAAIKKQQAGRRPTRDEAAALRRVEKARDEELRAEHYASVPKATWRAWSGHLAHKTLDDLADEFGIPTKGRTVDMAEVVRWLYDFLRQPEPYSETDTESPALEKIREWEAKRRELKFKQEAGELVKLADLDRGMVMIGEILRRAGETIRIEYGASAGKVLSNAWDDVRAKLDIMFAIDPDSEG